MIFHKHNIKDIVKEIATLNEKLDLIHKSVARLRIDLPELISANTEQQSSEVFFN